MASVRYLVLAACHRAGLVAQFGFESEAAAWLEKQGSNPCAYVYYRQGVGVAGFDNVTVVFGGSDPSAALRRVRDSLERSLEFRSDRQTEVGGFPATTLADYCYESMFTGCTFNMSDDGTTFNFQCAATLPQTVGEATFSTPAELAGWMGNTNGFTEP